MKISQLTKREDFYNILKITLRENTFSKRFKFKGGVTPFYSHEKLNIIFNNSFPKSSLYELTAEYKMSTSKLKTFMQSLYVFIVLKSWFKFLFPRELLFIEDTLNEFAVVGGNHRIRLFDKNLQNICVLLKSGENKKFVQNDIAVRCNYNIYYAPKIIEYGDDWLIESFVKGRPLNRLEMEIQKKATEELIVKHLNVLINPSKKEILLDDYYEEIKLEIIELLKLINTYRNDGRKISDAVDTLIFNINQFAHTTIDVALNHGDFQLGNIKLVEGIETCVIDWESAGWRFYLYDIFVLTSGIRTGVPMLAATEMFILKSRELKILDPKYPPSLIRNILCLEELIFNLNEDVSGNYFNKGMKAFNFVDSIEEKFL